MVGLIEHGADDHLDGGTTWLLTGSTDASLVLIAALMRTLDDEAPTASGQLQALLVGGAVVALAVSFLKLPPARWLRPWRYCSRRPGASPLCCTPFPGEHERMHSR